jgi:hypothetical protein
MMVALLYITGVATMWLVQVTGVAHAGFIYSCSEQCCYRTFDLMNKNVALDYIAFWNASLKAHLIGHPLYIALQGGSRNNLLVVVKVEYNERKVQVSLYTHHLCGGKWSASWSSCFTPGTCLIELVTTEVPHSYWEEDKA